MSNLGRLALFGTWVMAAALTLSACGGGHNGGSGGTPSSTTPVVPAPALVSIAVTPATATVRTGATQQFTATGTYSDKSTQVLTASVAWSSSNTAIATISGASGSQGLATAVGVGSTSIVATDGAIASPGVPLTVAAAAPTLVSIAVTPAAASVAAGATQQFVATGTYSDHSTKTLTTSVMWSSSNAAVASISNTSGSQGLAAAVSAGSDSIVAIQGSVMSPGATLTVTAAGTTPPSAVPTIKIQPAAQTVTVGQHALFNVIATGASTYQWFENGTAISGATSATYYTPAIQSTDAGASFTVVAGNSLGHVTSSAAALFINPAADGGPPANFWGNTAALPVATQSMTFSFVNQTNGVYPDSQVFWSVQGHTAGGTQVNEVHSIADQPTYDMPPLTSARMYFYIAPNASGINNGSTSYYDFIEFNIGGAAGNYNFNGDTTRVDAFGLKTAVRLVCADGTDLARGEDYGTFLEDRSITFLKYLAEVPAVFASTATQNAPYRIVNPGAADFGPGGANAGYYQSYLDLVWANNNIDKSIVPEPAPFLNLANGNLNDLSAALNRHVADKSGTFTAAGKLVNPNFWSTMPSSTFYQAGPANYYAEYWHTHGIGGYAYGFPYDDVGGHSSDIGCGKPTYLAVAIGW
jgi:Beta-1,3-glucanase/Bacterial Ig-like domain (group 2)